jgi:hypothetical protein
MKKIIFGFVLLMAITVSMAAHAGGQKFVIVPSGAEIGPADVMAVQLGPCKGDTTYDTLDASAAPNFFVLSLAKNATRPMFKYMATMAPLGAIKTSGDSVAIAYQLLPSTKLSDTLSAGWTVMDTIPNAGKNGAVVDLSAKVGMAIVFKITNIDATGINIVKPIRIVFKENSSLQAPVR